MSNTPAPPSEAAPPPKRPAERKRRLLRVFVTLLVFVAIGLVSTALWTRTEDFQRRVVPAATALCQLRSGYDCAIGAIHIDFLPLALRLERVHLTHRGTGARWIAAEAIEAPVVLRGGRPALGALALHTPRLRITLDAKGRPIELTDLPRGGKPMTHFPWSTLTITDGSVLVAWPEGEATIEALQLTPDPPPPTSPLDETPPQTHTLQASLAVRHRDQADTAQLHWAGLTLSGDHVHLPDTRLDTRTVDLTFAGTIPLQGPLQLSVGVFPDLEDLTARLPVPFAVYGDAEAEIQLSGPLQRIQAAVTLRWDGVQVDAPGVLWPVLHYRLGDLTAYGIADADGLDVESLRLAWADGEVLARGRLERDGLVPDLHVEGFNLSFGRILQELESAPNPWIDFRGDATLALSGHLKPFALDGTFNLDVRDLLVTQGPVFTGASRPVLALPTGHGEGGIHFEKGRVILDAKRVASGPNQGFATIQIGTGPKGPLDLDATLTDVDLAWFRPLGEARLEGTGAVSGRFVGPFNQIQFEGHGDLRDFSVMGIPYADHLVSPISSDLKTLRLTDVRAERGSTRYGGSWSLDFKRWWMDTDVVVFDGRVEDLVTMFIDVDGLQGDLKGTLQLAGPLNDLDGEAHLQLADASVYGERFPSGEAHGYMNKGLFTLDDLRLIRDGGRAGALLRGSVGRAWALNMELIADGLRLERLDHLSAAEIPIEGDLSLMATLGNTLFDPAPAGRLSARNVRYAGRAVEPSSIRFETESGVLLWSGKLVGGTVAARGVQGLWREQPYEIDAFFSRFPAHLFYPVGADGRPIEALVTGQLSLEGNFGPEPSEVDLHADVQTAQLAWGSHRLSNPKPWKYHQRGSIFELTDFALQGGATRFEMSATNEMGMLQASGGGPLDLDLARAIVPDLLRADGLAEVKVRAHGAAGSVDALVDATIDASLVQHAAFPGLFEDVHAELLATHDRYNLLTATASLGGGAVQTRGRILAENWRPSRFELIGAAEDAQVQWVEWLPPAIGNAAFAFDGPLDALLLSAEVEVTEMTFSDRMNWEDWVVEFRDYLVVGGASNEEAGMFELDVRIDADKTIHLANNLAEGTASANLRVIGDTARAGLVGNASVGDGLVFLNDREFRIERGELAWRDPWTWDPQLDFELLSDLTSRDRRYRIIYRILGPFSDWRTESRSEPPLSQADINALLWFGVTADDLEGMGDLYSAIGQGVADMVLADLFASNSLVGADDVRSLVRVDIATGVNTRGEYSPDPRLVLERRFDEIRGTDLRWEMNMVRTQDWYLRADNRISDNLSLSAWYASQSRSGAATGGALGADLRYRTEWDD